MNSRKMFRFVRLSSHREDSKTVDCLFVLAMEIFGDLLATKLLPGPLHFDTGPVHLALTIFRLPAALQNVSLCKVMHALAIVTC